MDKEHVKTTVFKDGYQVKEELWKHSAVEKPTLMKSAYNPSGDYLGNPRMVRNLIKKYGIAIFELRTKTSNVCSIGYSPVNKKWYGWSHRAIYGFGIGQKIVKGSTIAAKWEGKTIKSLEEAKEAASDFAESVS